MTFNEVMAVVWTIIGGTAILTIITAIIATKL